ncbi:histidine kinase [Paenibacillus oryzisoli]|uniref:sensor histidine kinase n=1 Tax=Paenibacillus oryzisoli TaxID=1850517 RepID=UPI003D29A941
MRKSFSRKLIISLGVVMMITFAVSGYITYKIHLHLFTEEISRQFSKTNEQAAARLDLQIRNIYKISNFIVFHPYVEQVLQRSAQTEKRETYTQLSDQDELNSLLYQVKYDEPKLFSMYLYDVQDNGFIFGGANAPSTRLSKDVYLDIKAKLEGSFGNLIWFPMQLPSDNTSSGVRHLFAAARQMKTVNQEKYGIMVMLFDESLISEYLNELVKDEQANVFLYDKMDNLVYSDLNLLSAAPEPGSITNKSVDLVDGKPYLYSKSRSGQVDFTLVSRVSLDALQSKSGIIFQVNVLIGIISVVLSGLLVFWTGNRLFRPLHRLVQGMRRMREGDFQIRLETRSDDELGFMAHSFNAMAENLDKLVKEVYERQLSEREAELTAIQAQLNPHFLHNTLDTIYWKLYLQDDLDTAELVVSLSDMLRYALEPVDLPTTLLDEFTQIRNYLTIQHHRFGHELETMVQLEEGIEQWPVPRLILQPLVENVFMHAFTEMATGQALIIRAYRSTINRENEEELGAIVIEIIDNGKGITEDQLKAIWQSARSAGFASVSTRPSEGEFLSSTRHSEEVSQRRRRVHIGIRSVIRRLNLLYGEPYGLQIESKQDAGTTFRLRLPRTEDYGLDLPNRKSWGE